MGFFSVVLEDGWESRKASGIPNGETLLLLDRGKTKKWLRAEKMVEGSENSNIWATKTMKNMAIIEPEPRAKEQCPQPVSNPS